MNKSPPTSKASSSSSSFSADSIARQFVHKYYKTLHSTPGKVPSLFYSPFAHRVTSYVANGNDKINEEQDSSASLQNHFTPKEIYYMDLKTTVSSVDASEVTFVQDKTLLVAVKGQFSSCLLYTSDAADE